MKSLLIISLILIIPFSTGKNPFQHAPFIIGGQEANKGEFPFLVSIWMNNGFICGGTLVKENVVVTAAHCVTEDGKYLPARLFKVKVGDHDIRLVDQGEQTKVVNVSASHPKYSISETHISNDIAVLITDTPFELSEHVKIAPLTKTLAQTNVGTAVGWGVVQEGGRNVSPLLQRVQLNISPAEDCSRKFGRNGFNKDVQLCAGGVTKGVCFGDSGGPFLVGNDKTFLGIVSYGTENCETDATGSVFQRVGPYVDWIQETIRNPPPPPPSDNSGTIPKVSLGTFVFIIFAAVIINYFER